VHRFDHRAGLVVLDGERRPQEHGGAGLRERGQHPRELLQELAVGNAGWSVICQCGYTFPTFQVSKKDEDGSEVVDFPFFHTAAAARSHVKCFLLKEHKIDIGNRRRFPEWGAWWKAYQGEVLKPNGKMQV
jgi:hypothetical protein